MSRLHNFGLNVFLRDYRSSYVPDSRSSRDYKTDFVKSSLFNVILLFYEPSPCHIFTLTRDNEKTLEDIHQQILLGKFGKKLTLPGGVNSVLGARSQQLQKLNQLPQVKSSCKEDLLVNVFKFMKSFFSISTVKEKIWNREKFSYFTKQTVPRTLSNASVENYSMKTKYAF